MVRAVLQVTNAWARKVLVHVKKGFKVDLDQTWLDPAVTMMPSVLSFFILSPDFILAS